MATLSAQSIRLLCRPLLTDDVPMVQPYHDRTRHLGRTFGQSSCGYDIRIAETVWLWPMFGRLASSIEYFHMPKDVYAEVKDKSTNARLFRFVQNTVIEPGWRGWLTLELTRDRPWPVRIEAGTPIAQIIFHRLDYPTDQPYEGKYQDQRPGAQKPILEGHSMGAM